MEALPQLNFWSQLQSIIETVCMEFDQKWQKRKRVLNTHFLVLLIFKLVLSKNKQGYNSLLCELWDSNAQNNLLKLPQKNPIAASSLCEARQKMPESIFLELNQKILMHWQQNHVSSTWQGHRIFAADGSKINLPTELMKAGYKIENENRCHHPTGLISTLYHLGDGMIYDFILQPTLDERLCAIEHMGQLSKGDVLVLDRGYFSYLLLYKSFEMGIHLICRMQKGIINPEIKAFWDSQEIDTVIEYYPSAPVRSKFKKRGFNLKFKNILLRLIKYTIAGKIYVCATTFIGENYPLEAFPKLYHGRWGIEELYKISKQFIEVEDFHSCTEKGIKQELYAHLLLINIARIFESEAKNNLPSPMKDEKSIEIKDNYWKGFCEELHKIKINFKNCLLVVGRYLEQLFSANRCAVMDWLSQAIASIVRVRQKIRPGRHYPRRSFNLIKKLASVNNSRIANA